MKRLKVIWTLLAAVVVGATALVAMTAVASAEEAATWLCASEAVGTKECLTLSENLEPLHFQDLSQATGTVVCGAGTVLSEGWVGPNGEDEVTKVEFMEKPCKATGTNCPGGAAEVIAINLPWLTALTKEAGMGWDLISENGGGLPGYEVTCLGVKDKCVVEATHTPLVLVENLSEVEGGLLLVSAVFLPEAELLEGKEELANCSLAGTTKHTGQVTGENLISAVRNGVAVSLEFN
jgi:hypothetical protein